MRDKSAPIPTGDAPALPRLSHFLSLFEYTGRAFALVFDTSRAITSWLGALSAAAGLLPAAIAYVGKLIVDAVVVAAQTSPAGALVTPWSSGPVLSFLLLELGLVVLLAAAQRGLDRVRIAAARAARAARERGDPREGADAQRSPTSRTRSSTTA